MQIKYTLPDNILDGITSVTPMSKVDIILRKPEVEISWILTIINEEIYIRFKIFEEEMFKYEYENGAYVFVDLKSSIPSVAYLKYSDLLRSKMEQSLTKEDFQLMYQKASRI